MKQCNIVADGCGARGLYAFAGAIEEIQKQYEIKNFAGVSAGAVVGALVKTGIFNKYNPKLLNKRPITPYRFVELVLLQEGLGWTWPKDFQVFISDLSIYKSEIQDYQSDFPMYNALERSCKLPTDGTICSNFPYIGGLNNNTDGLNKTTDIPTFGLFMYMDERPKCYLKNTDNPTIKDLFLAHFNYVDAQRIHKEHLPNTVRKIIYIPVMDIMATDFDLTDEQKESLYNNGREAAKEFLEVK